MVEIIGVRFSNAGKIYYFDPIGEKVKLGEMVVVETARGIELGRVSIPNREIPDEEIVAPLKPIIRVATEEDLKKSENDKIREKEAFKIAADLIREHKLKMKLIDVEYTFDDSKILFYFTADGRIDFRDLVRSLASVFKIRIELRQIGVRDEARMLGSIGICGRPLCCSTFLDDFRPVSIKMAKEQGLSLNPTKISGTCGRLMCCLQYEQAAYEDALKTIPYRGTEVETIDGRGVVVDAETLKQQVRVRLNDEEGHKTEVYKVGEFNIVGAEPTVSLDEVRAKKEAEAVERAESMFSAQSFMPEPEKEEEPPKNEGHKGRRRRKKSAAEPSAHKPKPLRNEDGKKPDKPNKPQGENKRSSSGRRRPNRNNKNNKNNKNNQNGQKKSE